MNFILANDANLAAMWAEREGLPDGDWCAATAGTLRAFPEGADSDHTLVILEGAEMSPEYALILDLARDRGFKVSSAPVHAGGHAAEPEGGSL